MSRRTNPDNRRETELSLAEEHILQILLAVSFKTISNYANHLFHTPVDAMFAHRAWEE